MTRAAVYCRISSDRIDATTGERAGLGVQRQTEDCLKLLQTKGWTHVETFIDNDVSAYSSKRRPEWERLLKLLVAGDLDAIVAWHPDRMYRRMTELERLVDLVEQHHVIIATVTGGEVDLATSSGRLQARLMGVVARHESEHKSERVARARLQEAESGRLHGSLGYGWTRQDVIEDGRTETRYVLNQAQAVVVREVTERILRREPLGSIARDLNLREVPTPGGQVGKWRGGNLRNMITAARFCGWREHRPETERRAGFKFGRLVAKGEWPAILTREQTEELRVILGDPSRKTRREVTELLVGVLRCGRCGSKMSAQHQGDTYRYACVLQPGLDRCGALTIAGPGIDRFVVGLALRALSDSEQVSTPEPPTGSGELAEVEQSLEQLAAAWGAGQISHAEWLAARSPLTQRREALSAVAETSKQSSLRRKPQRHRDELVRDWNALSFHDQRNVIIDLVGSVVIEPAHGRFKPPAQERVGRIEWNR